MENMPSNTSKYIAQKYAIENVKENVNENELVNENVGVNENGNVNENENVNVPPPEGEGRGRCGICIFVISKGVGGMYTVSQSETLAQDRQSSRTPSSCIRWWWGGGGEHLGFCKSKQKQIKTNFPIMFHYPFGWGGGGGWTLLTRCLKKL